MNLTPVIVMDAILLTVCVLVAIAERFLSNYPDCTVKVTENGETREFKTKGGSALLGCLQTAGVQVSAACGGKASCGYCKVRVTSGGGPVLPTEEVFLSREESFQNVRLACQVKVKEDIAIQIPDYLATVRNIVDRQMFDTKLKWRFTRSNMSHQLANKTTVPFTDADEAAVIGILDHHREEQGSLVPALQALSQHFNYLPPAVFPMVADRLRIPETTVFRVATFYNAFSLNPRGRNVISICLGTACHVKGAPGIVDAFERELGIKVGETTGDMMFTLEGVRCIGCCGLAPVLTVGKDVHGLLTPKKATAVLHQYKGSA